MRFLVVMLLSGAPAVVSAQTPATPAPAKIASISGVAVAPGPVVTITATGPLPTPRVGVLQGPDRIYVDLAGVSTRTVKRTGDGAVVTTVRAAQHGIDPLVTRIVIDLTQPCSYSVNKLQQAEGRLEISLTPKSPVGAPAAVPARAAAPAPASPARVSAPAPASAPASPAGISAPAPAPASPARVSAPASRAPAPAPAPAPASRARKNSSDPAMRRYLAKLKSALDTVETLRDVLNDIDQGHNVPPERLSSARLELAHLQAALNSAHPPSKFEEVDGLLKSVGAFASTALDLASKSTGEVPKNASSAAAGALMMLDRALAQLDQNDSAKDQFAALLVGW